MPQIVLDTLYGNSKPAAYRYGRFDTATFDEFVESFLQNTRSYIQMVAECFGPYEERQHEMNPEPMLSAFTDDCIARGKDITRGGGKYYNKSVTFVGLGTVCDSLLSIKAAYEEGSLSELRAAVKANFVGYEDLRKKIKSGERFGHSKAADEFVEKFVCDLATVSKGIYNPFGVEWHTSLFTYHNFQVYGEETGATPDGRLAGESLSRQMNMADMPDLTTAASSLSLLSKAEFDDVGTFDIALPMAGSDTYREKLPHYIRTCLELKIPVLQTNVVDKEMLIEEHLHKGTHPDLVVRVSGYSALFGGLTPEAQKEVIGRFS